MTKYRVLLAKPAQRDLRKIPPEHQTRLRAAIQALGVNPREQTQKLKGEPGFRRRVGDYRIVFRVDESEGQVLVTRVRHRRDVYRRLGR